MTDLIIQTIYLHILLSQIYVFIRNQWTRNWDLLTVRIKQNNSGFVRPFLYMHGAAITCSLAHCLFVCVFFGDKFILKFVNKVWVILLTHTLKKRENNLLGRGDYKFKKVASFIIWSVFLYLSELQHIAHCFLLSVWRSWVELACLFSKNVFLPESSWSHTMVVVMIHFP